MLLLVAAARIVATYSTSASNPYIHISSFFVKFINQIIRLLVKDSNLSHSHLKAYIKSLNLRTAPMS